MLKGLILQEKLVNRLISCNKADELKRTIKKAVEQDFALIFISDNINEFCASSMFNGDIKYKKLCVFDPYKRVGKRNKKKIDSHELSSMLDIIKISPKKDRVLFVSDDEADYRFVRCDMEFLYYSPSFHNGRKKKPFSQIDRIDKILEVGF